MANPLLVELIRGGIVESGHRGALAVAKADGEIVASIGDVGAVIFPRSAIKAIQAIPLVESGAADAYGYGAKELALACASHNGERRHVKTARAMLERAGLEPGALACGAHEPMSPAAARALVMSGSEVSALHNNCSGKHAGMLATAKHLGEPIENYHEDDHPVQKRIRGVVGTLCGVDLADAPCGIDGCSVPTWGLAIKDLATGFARFVSGDELDDERRAACARLLAACLAEPEYVAGKGQFCSDVMRALGDRAFVKVGAEGVYCGGLPDQGLGIALKIDDGAKRACEVAMAAVLLAYVPEAMHLIADRADRVLRNWRGLVVGQLRASDTLRQALQSA